MGPWLQMAATVFCSVIASSGFWAFVQKKSDKNDAELKMLVGLAHDRITWLGMKYIEAGHITQDEYENLNNYLYEPYQAIGGNGSARKIMQEVNKLPIHKDGAVERED